MWYEATTFSSQKLPICSIIHARSAQFTSHKPSVPNAVTDTRSGWLMHRKRMRRPEGGVTSRHSGHVHDVRSQYTTTLTYSFSLYIEVLRFCPPARAAKYSGLLIFLRLRTGPADQLSGLCGEGVRAGRIGGRGNWYPRSCTWVSHKA